MYEELNCFEEALKHFGTRVEVICAMELGGRINPEDAYQMIKDEMKEVKKCRKIVLCNKKVQLLTKNYQKNVKKTVFTE